MQVKGLEGEDVPMAGLQRALGTSSDFVVRKTVEQARAYTLEELMFLQRGLLDVDIAIKTGGLDDGLVLEVLVADWAGSTG